MDRRGFFSWVGMTSLLCLSTACTPARTLEAVGKIGKIAMNPDIPLGPPKDQPSDATITLYAEPGANRTPMADAPVDVWIFELSGDDQLMSTDFLSLSQSPKDALGPSYVKHQTKQLSPGASEVLPIMKLTKDTNFIGVAVGFSNLDKAVWRAVAKVKPVGENYNIVVPLSKDKVAIQVHR